MKREVSKEEYFKFFQDNPGLKPLSSFSDPSGQSPYGIGRPAMDTDWGISGPDIILAVHEMRKDALEEDEWQTAYYLTDALRNIKKDLKLGTALRHISYLKWLVETNDYFDSAFKGKFNFRLERMIDYDDNTSRYSFCEGLAYMFVNNFRFRALFTGYTMLESDGIFQVLREMTPFQRGQVVFAKLVGQECSGFTF